MILVLGALFGFISVAFSAIGLALMNVSKFTNIQAFDIPPGNLLAYYPEANALTEHHLDPPSKTPNFKSVAVCTEPL